MAYEDEISDDPRVAHRKVCEFLGLQPAPVEIRFGKTNPFPLCELIRNFAEVESALRGTCFEWMLHE